MKKLKTSFESFGFTNVVTYTNSDNIIFEHVEEDYCLIVTEIEKAIKKDFRLLTDKTKNDFSRNSQIQIDKPTACWIAPKVGS